MGGRHVRLEPLSLSHSADLFEAASHSGLDYLSEWRPTDSLTDFQLVVEEVLALQDNLPFAVVEQESGRAIGSSSFLDIRPRHRAIEIGRTWIGAPHRGTYVNPEMKLLMLTHAFDILRALRVCLKTDGRNLRSQNAIRKLGAVEEGTLRRHMVCRDGYVRDTVYFSVLAEEFEAVRAGLLARLEQ